MEILPDELLQRLDALALATGSSLEILWAALVKGGFGVGVVSVIGIVFAFGGFYVCFLLGSASVDPDGQYSSESEFFLAAGSITTFLISVVFLICCMSELVYLYAPELYAVRKLLGLLRD